MRISKERRAFIRATMAGYHTRQARAIKELLDELDSRDREEGGLIKAEEARLESNPTELEAENQLLRLKLNLALEIGKDTHEFAEGVMGLLETYAGLEDDRPAGQL